jgi:two-component system nitrogen regulation response regulator GlnG
VSAVFNFGKHSVPTLLIVDDEPSILHFFRRAFCGRGIHIETAISAQEGIDKVRALSPDVVVLDVNLCEQSGLDLFRKIQQVDARIPVIFITGRGTTATAIEAMQLGAYEYLLKPLELAELSNLVYRAFEIGRLMRVAPAIDQEPDVSSEQDAMLGRSPLMQAVYKSIGRVAARDVAVLVLGESGTGKELVARAIYHYSSRVKGPFLAINCAAIPESLLESELFGHEKGAFTGADRLRIGKFEQCNGGTLFLDEIGDMSPMTQAKLLRVLQGQEFERVGGETAIRSDVRIIAATNRNLDKMVADGNFRADLYYRLNVFTIRLPPLRDRGDDLQSLARYFVRRFATTLNKDVHTIPEATLDLLRQYSWPGNIREFQSVIKQALLQTTGAVLLPEFLPNLEEEWNGSEAEVDLSALSRFIRRKLQAGSHTLYADCQQLTDRHLISLVLQESHGNLSHAARLLGITRTTLRTKVAALGLTLNDPQPSD